MIDRASAARLWRYLKPHWKFELITLAMMILLACLALAFPIAIQYMIDNLIPGLAAEGDRSAKLARVVQFGGALIGIYLAHVILGWTRDYFVARIGAGIIATIRSELFYHLELVSLRFYQRHQIGEIMSRLLSDVGRIQDLMTTTLLTFLANLFLLLAILGYLLTVNWMLTLVALVPVPLTILFSNIFGRKLNDITRRVQETTALLSARFQESFLLTRVVRAFGQEAAERKKVDSILDRLKGLYVRHSVTASLAGNFVHFVNMVGPIVVLAWGTYLVAGGTIKLGALVAFYILLSFLYNPIRDLASVNIEVRSAMASVTRIFEYLDLPPAIADDPHPVQVTEIRGGISFQNVCFRHDDNGFGFERLTFEVHPRETVAIVGPSGSGKTTIMNLLIRFFDPASGTITIDSVDTRKLPIAVLRRNIGLVDQEPMLFKASIFANIAYADSDATLDAVQNAARIANIHDFIAGLPDGYDSEVGERGVTLSGGERQRICLARAVLKDPPILILDEATSSLDSQSEQLIQDALKKLLTHKTAVIIAHRLSTVQHADRILVLDNGRIAAQGTHDELLTASPLYRDLATKQLLI